jgi:hypothetical protein
MEALAGSATAHPKLCNKAKMLFILWIVGKMEGKQQLKLLYRNEIIMTHRTKGE